MVLEHTFVGIDPGFRDGVVCIIPESNIFSPQFFSPQDSYKKLSKDLRDFIYGQPVTYAAIEECRVGARQKPLAAERMMLSYGSFLFWLCYENIPHSRVPPAKWMRYFGFRRKRHARDKPSLDFVKKIHPGFFINLPAIRSKWHNYTDAYCLALYAREEFFKICPSECSASSTDLQFGAHA